LIDLVDSDASGLCDEDGNYDLDEFIAGSSGLIFMIDPLSLEGKQDGSAADISEQIAWVADAYRKGNGIGQGKAIDIPIALTLTKCDHLLGEADGISSAI